MPIKCHPLVFPGENKTAGLSSDADWWRALGAAPSRDQPHPSCPGTLKGSSFTKSHTRRHFWILKIPLFTIQFIFVCRCRCCEHQVRKEAKPELWSVIWSANCDLQNQASLLHVHCSRNARKIMKKKILHREKSSEKLLNFCHSYSSESENILNVILCNYPLKTCQG